MHAIDEIVIKKLNEKEATIWNTKNVIQDVFKENDFWKVIMPFVFLKRLNDLLLPTKKDVLECYEKVKDFEVKDGFLKKAAGQEFYNTSPFSFDNLLIEPVYILENMKLFLNGFSENIQDVIENFDFFNTIDKLANGYENKLFYLIQEFNTESFYLGEDEISKAEIGLLFENLTKKFIETYATEPGKHYTSVDIALALSALLIAEDCDKDKKIKTVYDMAMGTGQMLNIVEKSIKKRNSNTMVSLYGQECNPTSYALAKAKFILMGKKKANIALGDTLINDLFVDYEFDYVISNPPFGKNWKNIEKQIKAEYKLGFEGRFGMGLPKISDSQLLFMLNGVKKLKDTGKMLIIQNGATLFAGNAESGTSEIRRYLIENDLLEAIIELPVDLFYDTGISTYIWLISKNKPKNKVGRVQLINASKLFTKRRRGIGNKKVDLDKSWRDKLVQIFLEAENKVYSFEDGKKVESLIFANDDFKFYKIIVETAKLDENGKQILKRNKPIPEPKQREIENIKAVKGEKQEETIRKYFEKEILPYDKNAWIEYNKTKVGYEIPFMRYFYEYKSPEATDEIAKRINVLERKIMKSMSELFGDK